MSHLPARPTADRPTAGHRLSWLTSDAMRRTFVLALAWVLLARGVLILHTAVWPAPGWALLSDLAGAVVLALLLSMRSPLPVRLVAGGVLATAYYAAAQHMLTHGTLFRLANIGMITDPVFRSGTLADVGIWMMSVYAVLAGGLFYLHRHLNGAVAPAAFAKGMSATVVVALYAATIPSLTLPANNVVASALAQVPGALLQHVRPPPGAIDGYPLARDHERLFFPREFSGHRNDKAPNVLFILVEGLSAGYDAEIAAYHGLEPVVVLPHLKSDLEQRGFRVWHNVLSMQRQTDRGSFVLLCGGYPRLSAGIPKISDVVDDHAQPLCLPQRFSDHGYRTAYLQAAPLTFMDKDRFLPAIGFDIVAGVEHFHADDASEGWGPGDDVFFPAALNWLRELHTSHEPWFATLLNVGTHHPFPLPESVQEEVAEVPLGTALSPAQRQSARHHSFEVMAEELNRLLDTLKEQGILDNTTVVITSDEAGGFLRGQREAEILDNNFGFLAVRPPPQIHVSSLADADTLVAGLDIPLSILDMAGISGDKVMVGRSLLVHDGDERGIMLADIYSGRTMFLLDSGRMLACDEALMYCNSWSFDPQRLFGTLEPKPEQPFVDFATRRQLVTRAEIVAEPEPPPQ